MVLLYGNIHTLQKSWMFVLTKLEILVLLGADCNCSFFKFQFLEMDWTIKFRQIWFHFIISLISLLCLQIHLITSILLPFILPYPMILWLPLKLGTLWYLITHLTVFPKRSLHILFHMKPSLQTHTQCRYPCPITLCPKLVLHSPSPKASWSSQMCHFHSTTKSCCLKRLAEHFQRRVWHRTSTAHHRELVLVTSLPEWNPLLPRIYGTRSKSSFRAGE